MAVAEYRRTSSLAFKALWCGIVVDIIAIYAITLYLCAYPEQGRALCERLLTVFVYLLVMLIMSGLSVLTIKSRAMKKRDH
jgi:hypothetical protein